MITFKSAQRLAI